MHEAGTTEDRPAHPVSSTWSRRALSIPTYLALAVFCFALFPALFLVVLASDLSVGRGSRLARTRAFGFFVVYLFCEAVGIMAAGVLWLAYLGRRSRQRSRYIAANAALQRWWTSTLFNAALYLFSMRKTVEGEACLEPAPFLLFVRHSSTADTVLAAELVGKQRRVLLRYVLKEELLWDPCLDLVGLRLPNAFISRRAEKTGSDIEAIAALAENLDDQSAVLLYPEGTRFSAKKLDDAVAKLRSQGRLELAEIASRFKAVLPPKLGGALALMEAAPELDIVFLEHSGFEGAATFNAFWGGALVGRELRVRFRRFSVRDIPVDQRARWLFERWSELDRWVTDHAKAERPTS